MSRSITRGAALFAAAGTLTLPLAFVPAYAAAPSCVDSTPDATEVVDGICEIIFDEAGSYTLKLPKDLKRVAAVPVARVFGI